MDEKHLCSFIILGLRTIILLSQKIFLAALPPGVQHDRFAPYLSVLSFAHLETYVVIPEVLGLI